MNYIEKIEGLPLFNLRVLNLSSNNMRSLENLESLINLELLDVSKNKLTSIGCLEKFTLKSLKRFFCAHNQIPSSYFEVLEASFIEFKYIEELDFIGNEVIQNKSFIPKLAHLPSLKILNGVPVFKPEGGIPMRKTAEKQKTELKINYNMNSFDFSSKGQSLKDIYEEKEENTKM